MGGGPSQARWREGLTWTLAVPGQAGGPSRPCSRCHGVHPDSLPEPQHPPPAAGNTCSQRLSSSLGHRHTPGPWSLPPWVGGMAARASDERKQGCRGLSALPQSRPSPRGVDCPVPMCYAEAWQLPASWALCHAPFCSSLRASRYDLLFEESASWETRQGQALH